MPRNLLVGPILAAAWLCALSCSFVVDTSEVDRGCGPGRKLCAGKCVEQSDHAYGCTPDLCDPCRLTNAIPRCDGNTCVVNACLFGFDCPDETTGCFTNILVDRENCGHCDADCQKGESCSNGACVPGQAGSGN
jgi:hypothetical protein